MSSSENENLVSNIKYHTLKKFELVENYIYDWAMKLLPYHNCDGIMYIDCMCNSGLYTYNKETIKGTAIRVAERLYNLSKKFQNKNIIIIFNDNNPDKINLLKEYLPTNTNNFKILVHNKDANELLKSISTDLKKYKNYSYFLFYDPYNASIDWDALQPYFNHWGEVLINHMVSDTIRGISQVKDENKKQKYLQTYEAQDINEIVKYKNKDELEKKVEDMIKDKHSRPSPYYISHFPFFNSKNVIVYNLIHCTASDKGFALFKKHSWKVFGNKSSLKDRHGTDNQLSFSFETEDTEIETDENCYSIYDIAAYLNKKFKGQENVPLNNIWKALEVHPIFPSDGYKKEIKNILKKDFGADIKKNNISFTRKD